MTDYLETWLDSESAGQSVIAVKTIYIDINDGSLTDGFLFSQIVYWSGKTKEGKYRAQTMVGGHRWIVKEADEWFAECRIKDSTARESLSRIQARGLIVKEVHRFHGKACTHLRINPKVFEARIKLALEGKPMPKLDKKGKASPEVSGLPKSSKATLPKSSNPYTDTTVSEITPDRVSSYEDTLAQPSQAPVDAGAPFLTPTQHILLHRLQSGRLVARYENPQDVQRLIDLRLIERCSVDGIVIKGKADDCPDDPKVQELQTAIQTAFLPGSNRNEPHKDETPSPQTPLPAQSAPAALPEVPFKPGDFVWWVPAEVQRNLCGTQPHIAAVVLNLSAKRVHILSDRDNTSVKAENLRPREKPTEPREWEVQALRTVWSDAKAAARAQGKAKGPKKVKPAIYSDDTLFEAIAAFCFKVTEKVDFKAIGGRVAKIRLALCDYVIEKLGREPTPDETAKVTERVKALPAWYDIACKKCDRPQSPDTFMTWYLRYLQSLNGTAQAEGDSIWFDGVKGAYLKREKGVLYEQDPMNGEKWIPAK